RAQRFAIPVELRGEVEIGRGTSFAVANAGLVDAHCDVPARGELTQDPAVRLRAAQRLVERPEAGALDEEDDRILPGCVRLRNDRADARAAADDVVVEHIEGVAAVARPFRQRHRPGEALSVTDDRELDALPGWQAPDRRQELKDAVDRAAIDRHYHVTRRDAFALGG